MEHADDGEKTERPGPAIARGGPRRHCSRNEFSNRACVLADANHAESERPCCIAVSGIAQEFLAINISSWSVQSCLLPRADTQLQVTAPPPLKTRFQRMALSPAAIQKLLKEYRDLQQTPVDGVTVRRHREGGSPASLSLLDCSLMPWPALLTCALAPALCRHSSGRRTLQTFKQSMRAQVRAWGAVGLFCGLWSRGGELLSVTPGRAAVWSAGRASSRCVSSNHASHPALATCSPDAAGTPFEGGVFRMKLVFPADYPAAPPKGECPLARRVWRGEGGGGALFPHP